VVPEGAAPVETAAAVPTSDPPKPVEPPPASTQPAKEVRAEDKPEAVAAAIAEAKLEHKTYSSADALLADIEARRAEIAAKERPRWTSVTMGAAQLSALNPLMVMLIIPGLNILVYAPLRKRGIEVKPLQKMAAGMFIAAAAFAAAAVLQVTIETAGDGVVHGLWQAVPYFIITVAEVLVSITGLEFAYTQAPRAMKSTLMSIWLLCVTFGNLIVAFLAPLQKTFELSEFFWVFTGLMAGAAVVFTIIALLYRGKSYLQQAAPSH
jgi:dipeptide/tripeptide permease